MGYTWQPLCNALATSEPARGDTRSIARIYNHERYILHRLFVFNSYIAESRRSAQTTNVPVFTSSSFFILQATDCFTTMAVFWVCKTNKWTRPRTVTCTHLKTLVTPYRALGSSAGPWNSQFGPLSSQMTARVVLIASWTGVCSAVFLTTRSDIPIRRWDICHVMLHSRNITWQVGM